MHCTIKRLQGLTYLTPVRRDTNSSRRGKIDQSWGRHSNFMLSFGKVSVIYQYFLTECQEPLKAMLLDLCQPICKLCARQRDPVPQDKLLRTTEPTVTAMIHTTKKKGTIMTELCTVGSHAGLSAYKSNVRLFLMLYSLFLGRLWRRSRTHYP